MTDRLQIRPVVAADRAEWGRLWQAYLAFYETELPAATYDSSFARLLSPDAHEYHGLIATVAGRPVGLTHYLFHRTMWDPRNTCYLQDLYVDPSERGTGMGRALIEAVYAAATTAGAESVYWHTQHFNATARQLYDRIAEKTPFIQYARTLPLA